jgi:hypothetical protein
MDFLWNHIKALIYTLPVDSEEDRIACIVEAAATIRQQSGIFEHTSVSAVSLYTVIEVGNCTFEHML